MEIKNNYCIEVNAKLSKENFLVNSKDNNSKLSIEVKADDVLRGALNEKQGVNICIVLDKSYSMSTILDKKEVTPIKGVVNVEGRYMKKSKTGTTRLMVAIEAARNVVDLMGPNDVISCVIFADDPVVLFENKTGKNKEEIKRLLDYHAHIKSVHCGVSTNISAALYTAYRVLKNSASENVKKIMFLTDGEPTVDTKEKGISQAQMIAEAGITLDCIGFGTTTPIKEGKNTFDQVNFAFLQDLSAPSKGKTELIYDAEGINRIFTTRMKKTQEVLITDAKLHLTFRDNVRVNEHYRAIPENSYLGKVKLDKSRRVTLNLGQIEKNQLYKYFIQLNIPGQENYLGKIGIMKAEVEYKIPAIYGNDTVLTKMNATVNKTTTLTDSFVLEINSVNDPNLARKKEGSIETSYMLAEVKKFEADAEIARSAGEKDTVVSIYKKIIQIYTNLRRMQEAKMYEELLDSFIQDKEFDLTRWTRITSTTSQSCDDGLLSDLSKEELEGFSEILNFDPFDDNDDI